MFVLYLVAVVAGLVKNTDQGWIPFDTSLFTHYQSLNFQNDKNIDLFWKLSADHKEIEFGVASHNGAGWVGIGTSNAGGMEDANIFVGRKDSKNDFILEERYAETFDYPPVKKSQQAKLISSFQSDNVTAFTFSVPIYTGLTVDKATWLIFAYGDSNKFGFHKDAHQIEFRILEETSTGGDYATYIVGGLAVVVVFGGLVFARRYSRKQYITIPDSS
ncbi:hypothetical protein BC833DRAFT_587606 [Globomyces pollinis-pini]|nr:hypothetical protein BC833DRAFT_587606 [Globomyces pollinis-pini]